MSEQRENPPVPKYRLTLTVTGNSHNEITSELLSMTRGGYLLDSDYETRDEFHVIGARRTSVLVHTNPEMTPERYDAELESWWQARKAERATVSPSSPVPGTPGEREEGA